MTVVARETVSAALFTQLQTAGAAFKTYSRTWKTVWDDPAGAVADLPLLVQVEQRETVQWGNRGIGAIRRWGTSLLVYAKIPDGETPGVPDPIANPGSTILNPLLDAIEEALAPSGADGLQTLGGLVIDCRIEGEIIKVLGDEDPSGVCGAIVPIMILVQ